VDRSSHWVIRRPRIPRIRRGFPWVDRAWLAMAVPAMIAVGCEEAGNPSSPFDYSGPQFLQFYAVLYLLGILLADLTRHLMRTPARPISGRVPSLDSDEIAYLAGGKARALQAAIAALADQGAIQAGGSRGTIAPSAPTSANRTPLQDQILASANQLGFLPVRLLGGYRFAELDRIGQRLKSEGLLVADDQATLAVFFSLLVATVPPLVGLVKICVGVSRDRPVGFLAILCLVSVVLNLVFFARRPLRSRFGDRVLGEIRARYDYLGSLGSSQHEPTPEETGISVGLFGLTTLAGGSLAYLLPVFTPPGPASGAGSCSSSNCSASSCSTAGGNCSGSSCGGGGGSGGGCGGCSSN
jgi:uncharacterized protein (TIGR04222 family)